MKNAVLAQAIAQKRLVELRYKDWSRTVQPHKYGVDEAGEEKLLCWQTAGGSESGERTGWKLLKVSDIRATTMSEAGFAGAKTGYAPEKLPMRHIYAQL